MIETKIGQKAIEYTWNDELPLMLDNTLIIRYDVDVSDTPRHLANWASQPVHA